MNTLSLGEILNIFGKWLSTIGFISVLSACGGSGSDSNPSDVTPSPSNQAPTIVLEQEYVFDEQELVSISPVVSDSDGSIQSSGWVQIAGPIVSFDILDYSLNFTAPETNQESYTLGFRFAATDNDGSVTSVDINIRVNNLNEAPTALINDSYTVFLGTGASFNAANSFDPDGDLITYEWVVRNPNGNEVTLTNNSNPSIEFTANELGVYTINLRVSDSAGLSDLASATLRVLQSNLPPTARIDVATTVTAGTNVRASAEASSDPEGDSLSYVWTLATPSNSTAILTSDTLSSTSFVADVVGEFTLSLTVSDGELNSETTSVTITSEMANSAPTADAGDDIRIAMNNTVVLDGTASSDINNDVLTYQWDLISSSTSTPITLLNSDTAQASFDANALGEFVFRLTVSDGQTSHSDNVLVTIFEADIVMCQLTEDEGNENCEDSRFAWPHVANYNNAAVTNQTFVNLLTYVLIADGADYTVNITLYDRNNEVVPYVEGIVDGQVIQDGERVEFTMSTPLTFGEQADILYIIEIEEKPEYVHTVNYRIRTL